MTMYPDSMRQKVVGELFNGSTIRAAAKKYKITPNTVSKWKRQTQKVVAPKTETTQKTVTATTNLREAQTIQDLRIENARLKMIIGEMFVKTVNVVPTQGK